MFRAIEANLVSGEEKPKASSQTQCDCGGRIYLFRKKKKKHGAPGLGELCLQTGLDAHLHVPANPPEAVFETTKCDHATSWHRINRIYSGKSPN